MADGGGADADATRTVSSEVDASDADAALVCDACGTGVTRESERVEVGGAREHTFVNPGGFVFVIGTFAVASVVEDGESSSAWSWFPGFRWTIAGCTRCHVHLGWSFRREGEIFYGLVLDRLRAA